MASISNTNPWMMDKDSAAINDFEPSLMTSGICPMSVFDKFGWDSDLLSGTETDELLDTLCMKSEFDDISFNEDEKVDIDNLDLFRGITSDDVKPDATDLNFDYLQSISPLEPPSSSFDEFNDLKMEPVEDSMFDSMLDCTSIPSMSVVKQEMPDIPEFSDLPGISDIPELMMPTPAPTPTTSPLPFLTPPKNVIKIKRGSISAVGRRVKALVVCPDRRRILCNVVRSASNGLYIKNQSLLNGVSTAEPKVPIRLNVISSSAAAERLQQQHIQPKPDFTMELTDGFPMKIKDEIKIERPETPQSMVGSEEDFDSYHSFLDDKFGSCNNSFFDDEMDDEAYKCFPLAEVTGQRHLASLYQREPLLTDKLESIYTKLTGGSSAPSSTQENQDSKHYNSLAAANVDHDYGFTCRTPNVLNADSLGIQTPSASEPPTDSDDDEPKSILNHDLDYEEHDYIEKLKHHIKIADLLGKPCEKLKRAAIRKISQTLDAQQTRQQTPRGRARKRGKYGRPMAELTFDSRRVAATKPSTIKVRLPRTPSNDRDQRRRKAGTGGRIFSPTERHLHNTNEQVRRIEMRQSFEDLRCLVPNLLDKPRAPKVTILQEARMYCDELFHTDLRLQTQSTTLRYQQERLRVRVSELRRVAAASRS